MSDQEARCVAWVVGPKSETIFSEMCVRVEIDDELAGEFVVLTGQHEEGGKVMISPEEWPALRRTIDAAIKSCRDVPK